MVRSAAFILLRYKVGQPQFRRELLLLCVASLLAVAEAFIQIVCVVRSGWLMQGQRLWRFFLLLLLLRLCTGSLGLGLLTAEKIEESAATFLIFAFTIRN